MNKAKQRIAIAEGLGWEVINDTLCHITPDKDGLPQVAWIARFPDYLNDLNAMHEAEKVLTYKQSFIYTNHLEALTQTTTGLGGTSIGRTFQTIGSTAAQRAEAFLRTIGKWEDDK
jgi:alpha-N-acetylglucosamine transferase